ncbi:MAG: D-cysteine desulfhydrase family protein [Armatimonadota bacterium]|nr:D-cysteine desulfhydrase family protein [Armatimonadota bacterium]
MISTNCPHIETIFPNSPVLPFICIDYTFFKGYNCNAMILDDLPRIKLAHLPTALEDAPRLAAEIGVSRLLVKRDDATGLALGGNKARKLEYLMAEAKKLGADVVLTCGGRQSNHARMTAAAARKLGMDAILFLNDPKPDEFQGNLLLDTIFGAEIRFLPGVGGVQLEDVMAAEAERLKSQGRKPYVIPVGGSTPLGALGYVKAIQELAHQLDDLGIVNPDIVLAVGSCGTISGVVVGCHLFLPEARVIGISVSRSAAHIREQMRKITVGVWDLLRADGELTFDAFEIYDGYIGEAYGIPTESGKHAILLAARTEGLILDPVYTGKAMAGLIDLAREGKIGSERPVLFWHTGGAGGLFAYKDIFYDEAVALSQ